MAYIPLDEESKIQRVKITNQIQKYQQNKDDYVTINEAIRFAQSKGASGLGTINRNRFQKANIKSPYGKLDIQEYQRMAKMKRGIQSVSNLSKKFNGSSIGKNKPLIRSNSAMNMKNNAANRMKKLTNANKLLANIRANVGGGRKPRPLTHNGRAEEQKRKNNAANRMKKLTNANNLLANLRSNVGGGS